MSVQRQTAKCPHGRKHWPGEWYGSEWRGPAQTQSTVCEISRKTGIPKSSIDGIIWKDLQLKCFKRQRAEELRLVSWSLTSLFSTNMAISETKELRWTTLLISYFWRSFPSLPRISSSLQMKRCSLWLQQWKNCENRLKFHWVKANKIKCILKSAV